MILGTESGLPLVDYDTVIQSIGAWQHLLGWSTCLPSLSSCNSVYLSWWGHIWCQHKNTSLLRQYQYTTVYSEPIWMAMAHEHRIRFPWVTCSSTKSSYVSFYSLRTKENDKSMHFPLRWGQKAGRLQLSKETFPVSFKFYLTVLLALEFMEARCLLT